MQFLRKILDEKRKNFLPGAKYEKLMPVFEGFETFVFTPRRTAKADVQVFDSVDLKRVMMMVILALVPCLLFGMYNVGYQHYEQIKILTGADYTHFAAFLYGGMKVVPMLIVSYGVGLGIEFFVSYLKGREIEEGFLVSGMLIPMIMPVDMPLWMLGLSTAFAVIIGKEIFGGTGMNIWNPALLARAFAFFSYPTYLSGNKVWVDNVAAVDGMSGETILGQLKEGANLAMPVQGGADYSIFDMFMGFIPGSVGETSTILIVLGGIFLIYTGIASWRIMLSGVIGGALIGLLLNAITPASEGAYTLASFPWWQHLMVGGFAFGIVFMATDPVTGAQTNRGKWIYGLLVGAFAVLFRIVNPAYPEGMMLAILLMNTLAPTIDHYVVQSNVKKRMRRMVATTVNQ